MILTAFSSKTQVCWIIPILTESWLQGSLGLDTRSGAPNRSLTCERMSTKRILQYGQFRSCGFRRG